MKQKTSSRVDLNALLSKLDSYIELVIKTQQRIQMADGKNMYSLDLLSMAVSNRAIRVIQGFIQATESSNMLVSLPLVRLHIDTLLRWYATTLVEHPHELAKLILSGSKLKDVKDREEKKLTDSYLVGCYSNYFSQLKTVYEKTSGYIHLSQSHMTAPVYSVESEGTITWMLSRGHKNDSSVHAGKVESTLCMIEITEHIIHLLDHWAEQKNSVNGEVVHKTDKRE
ncbi:MAG: hypothetical protein JNL32_04445 [Candidatus Kapabacteria bacterium]|nr:hypothetical protein [Candidatus Kapabacteria bacterium]